MAEFRYSQAEELHSAFTRRGVRYLFLGNSAAILLGFPDTTQDVDVYPARSEENGRAIAAALRELGFDITPQIETELERGKDLVQIKSGPFDVDVIFAPDGIDDFETAWRRHVDVSGFPVCHLDDIIASKQAANRTKDRETLPRLVAFRDYWKKHCSL